MIWIQQLLSDPELRATLGWLAGGIATVASGIWVIVRFFIEKRTNEKRSDDRADISRANQEISASGRGVTVEGNVKGPIIGQVGRDVNVGVKGAYVVILVLFLVAILLFVFSAFGDNLLKILFNERTSIPTFSLSLSCGSSEKRNPYQISEEERKHIVNFRNFIDKNKNTVVYLDVSIEKNCNACECARAVDADRRNYEFEEPYIGALYINQLNRERDRQGVELEMFAPEDWAVSIIAFLPGPGDLSDSQYHYDLYRLYLARYNGLFTARYNGNTGVHILQLDILHPSDQQEKQLRCIREGAQISALQRLYLGCA